MPQFHNKTVLITGASSGIGAAMAREFAREGAALALVARRRDRLEALASELRAGGTRVGVFVGDVAKDDDMSHVVSLVRQELGTLDVVIANAGFGVVGDVAKLTLADYRRQFETNVYGVIRTVQATLEDLKQTRGSIGVVGSVNGFVSLPGNSPYAMSKFALRAFCDSLYHELRPQGVSVTHIAPGFVDSEIRKVDNEGTFHPRAKDRVPEWLRMRTEDAARHIVRAMAARRREYVVTAHGKFVVWLERHFSWLLHILIGSFKITARTEP